MTENLKFGPPGVGCHGGAKVFPLVYLSPLLTVMNEFMWIMLYLLVNILKIDPWVYFSLSLLCYKVNHKGDVDFNPVIQKTLTREYNTEIENSFLPVHSGLRYTLGKTLAPPWQPTSGGPNLTSPS